MTQQPERSSQGEQTQTPGCAQEAGRSAVLLSADLSFSGTHLPCDLGASFPYIHGSEWTSISLEG